MPTALSIADKYRGDILNDYFVCPILDKHQVDNWPKYWIHGHTHESFDYDYEGTRIVCNPYGYYGSNLNYQPDFVIEVSEEK